MGEKPTGFDDRLDSSEIIKDDCEALIFAAGSVELSLAE